MRTRPEINPQQTAHCLLPSSVNVAGGTLVKQVDIVSRTAPAQSQSVFRKKLKLAGNAYEECLRIGWNEARSLQTTVKSRQQAYRKCKEPALMAFVSNPTRQPSLNISPMWVPPISKEVSKL
jgi:hypothetical protein